ncbi:MAG: DUF2304 domain-containing protein [Candidatus Woesearchaeota archaeon]|nr:MAG: DUF2304 domain-containing protein [Candidatus Woesearchaeota archaeon]
MVVGIQIIGIIFGIGMLFFSYVYFRRKDFGPRDFLFWVIIWLAFIYAVSFPKQLNILLDTLGIVSALWLFTIVAFLILFALVFYLHVIVRRNQMKLGFLVKKLALKKIK